MRARMYRVLFLLAALLSGDALAARRVAVLVGANKGAISGERTLLHAEADARNLGAVLTELGGFADKDVVTLAGADADKVLAELDKVPAKLEGASAQETVFLFYYSGHSDGKDLHLSGTSLPIDKLYQRLRSMPATVKVGIIDACRSGSFIASKGATPVTAQFDYQVMEDDVRGTIFLTSSGADELSLEAVTGSFFTGHLVSGLRGSADFDGDRRMSLDEVYNYAYTQTVQATMKTTAGTQHPSFSKDLKGHGKLFLTKLEQGPLLLFPPGEKRYFVTTPDEGQLVAEVVLKKKQGLMIALPPGEYLLKYAEVQKYKVARFLMKEGRNQEVSQLSYTEEPLSNGVLKGTADEMAKNLGNKLVARSDLARAQPEHLDLSVLLALEALRQDPSSDAYRALHEGLERLPLVQTCFKHGSAVHAVAWSPDGKQLATAGSDKDVRVWDLEKQEQSSRVTLSRAVGSLAWSAEGTRLTMVPSAQDADREAVYWEFKPGQSEAPQQKEGALHALDPAGVHVVPISQEALSLRRQADLGEVLLRVDSMRSPVSFSADGRFLAALDFSGRARVWDVATLQEVLAKKPVEPSSKVSMLAISPDGRLLALAQEGASTVQVWEVTGARQFSLPAHDGPVTALAFASANTLLTASKDKTVRLWEATMGRELLRMQHEGEVESVALSPDGLWLATTWQGGRAAAVWSLSSGQEFTRLAHTNLVKAVAWNQKDYGLATGSEDGMACVWKIPGEEVTRMQGWGQHTAMVFSKTGRVLVTSTENEPACFWDTATGSKLACLKGPGGSNLLVLSEDGKFLATASGAVARVWEVTTGKELFHVQHDAYVHALVFSLDGALLASASHDGTARIWDVASRRERYQVKHDGPIKAVAFSPEGKRLATGGEDKTARIWEVATGIELLKLEHPAVSCEAPTGVLEEACDQPHMAGTPPALETVLFNQDGRYLATATLDGVVRLWDAENGKETLNLPQASRIRSMAFTPDGRGLAIANGDPVVSIWDIIEPGQELPPMDGQDGIIFLQYSADGKYLLTLSDQGIVSLSDSSSRRVISRTLAGLSTAPPLLSPDGRYLATVREQGNGSNLVYSLYLWQREDLVEQACSRLRRNLTQVEWTTYLGPIEQYQKTCPELP